MAVSEKIYMLRKKSGLSQEQLAEALHVSRQAVSKWELGSAVPESEKLIAISDYFQVSLDYLLKEETADTELQTGAIPASHLQEQRKGGLGFWLCIGGILCLILWGVLFLRNPAVSAKISESSMITIDGNGIFLILCITAIAVGTMLLLKGGSKKE